MNRSPSLMLLSRTCSMRHAVEGVERRVEGDERQDVRRAADEAADALGRAEIEVEGERSGMAEPAGERRARRRLVARGDVEPRRGAGAAVQVLVGAADGEVDAAAGEIDRQRAGGVGEIPQNERAGCVRPAP